MLAVAIALILFGYTVAYAGAKNYAAGAGGISLASAFNCTASGQTPVNEARPGTTVPGQNLQPRYPVIPGNVIGPGSGPFGLFPGPLSPGPLAPQTLVPALASSGPIQFIASGVDLGLGALQAIGRGAVSVAQNVLQRGLNLVGGFFGR